MDEGLLNLSKATQEGLERAKQFTLEVPTVRVVREASTGSQMMQFEKMSKSLADTGLGKSLDNLAAKAKHVENTRLDKLRTRNAFYGTKVDDVVWDASEELSNLRRKWKVPETDTIAVGKTNVTGLEGKVFEGGSPKVRKEAGLSDLDDAFPDREIRSSGKISSATRHAEENVANDFINAIKEVGLEAENVTGTFKIHQSNPKGVCPTCLSGLGNPAKHSGVIKQLSEMFPKLRIEVTSEVVEGVKVNGRLQFIVENGKYVKN